ncbi:uncharacterized protein EDB91DRAFT_1080619 [Suillus paluster]|uniref:uncharacterized protein n=1 Tax=Suillus paluster TaxID=48578 RepID=UPI001B883717|nr:uncharacterized protein EDB91DRAFT_1080619 [Suillus paluster]KAG1745127.1 hypothetical protein EDB91DRAFT_1080619 [Suillus paluster]
MSSAMSFMPPSTSDIAPRFTGIASEPLPFFHEVARLVDIVGLSDPACIKAALRYTEEDEADLWTYQEESCGDNYEEFANAVLQLYPGFWGTHYYQQEPVEVIIDEALEAKSPAPDPSAEVSACITDDLPSEEYVHWSDIFDPFTDESTFIDKLPFFDNIEPSAISQASDSGSDTYPQIIAPLASSTCPLVDLNPSDRTARITNESALSDFPSTVFTLHDPSSLPVLRVVTQKAGVMDVDFPSTISASHDPSSLPVLHVVTWKAGVMDVDFLSAVLIVAFILRVQSILHLGLLRRHLEFSSTFPSDDFRVIRDIPDDRIGLLASYPHSHFNNLHRIEFSSDPQSHKAYQPVSMLHMSPSHISSALSALRIRRIASIQTLQETTHTAFQVHDQPPSHAPAPSDTTRSHTSDTGIHLNERIPHIVQQSYWYQVHPSTTPIIRIAPHHHALSTD